MSKLKSNAVNRLKNPKYRFLIPFDMSGLVNFNSLKIKRIGIINTAHKYPNDVNDIFFSARKNVNNIIIPATPGIGCVSNAESANIDAHI